MGGGVVGSSVAYGLADLGGRVAVVDEGDRAFRASRGNFGLVWVQGKGYDYTPYAQWTRYGAELWPKFSDRFTRETGVDVQYSRPGGMEFCLQPDDWDRLNQEMQEIKLHSDLEFKFEMLEHSQLKKRIPEISGEVHGACFCPHDGHVNPLYLLRALHHGMDMYGVDYRPENRVKFIETKHGGFIVHTTDSILSAGKIVLCAGLDNQRLGKMVDINIPVKANRGQLLITERVQPFLHYPTSHVRQTAEGGLQIGDSKEDAGLDDSTSNPVISMLAARAVKIFPLLKNVNVVRAWAALRVMTPDGKPIYQQSKTFPGAYAVACHSGVTLAAVHASAVSRWISDVEQHPLITNFSNQRFNVQTA